PRNVTAHSLSSHEKGRLALDPPSGNSASAFDEYVSDPAKPVPYFDKIGFRMLPDYMVADQRFAARRPDVLVYESDVLEHDVRVAGPLVADLHVSTSGT